MTDDLLTRLTDWEECDEGRINDARQEAADRLRWRPRMPAFGKKRAPHGNAAGKRRRH